MGSQLYDSHDPSSVHKPTSVLTSRTPSAVVRFPLPTTHELGFLLLLLLCLCWCGQYHPFSSCLAKIRQRFRTALLPIKSRGLLIITGKSIQNREVTRSVRMPLAEVLHLTECLTLTLTPLHPFKDPSCQQSHNLVTTELPFPTPNLFPSWQGDSRCSPPPLAMLLDPHSWVAFLWFWQTTFNQPSANGHGWIGSKSLLHHSHSLYSHSSCGCGTLGVAPPAAITLLHYSASFFLQFAPTNLHIVLYPLLPRAALLSSSELILFVLLSQLSESPC